MTVTGTRLTGPGGAAGPPGPPGDPGAPGAPGVPRAHLGAWSSGTTYQAGYAVERAGSTWLALVGSTGVDPASTSGTWQLLAARGLQGPAGTGGGGGGGGPGVLWLSRGGLLSLDPPAGGSMPIIIPVDMTLAEAVAAVGVAPLGAALLIDIVDDAGTSVLGGTLLTIPAGSRVSAPVTPNRLLLALTVLHLKVTQLGSDPTARGQDLNVALVPA